MANLEVKIGELRLKNPVMTASGTFDLEVNIGELRLKNPVMTASGTFGYGLEFADLMPLDGIGGIIVKGTTLKPREGNDYPRMAETASGMLNCVGLQNKGVDYFCEHIYPQIKDIDTNMIVNVSGSSPEDYAEEYLLSQREGRRNGLWRHLCWGLECGEGRQEGLS